MSANKHSKGIMETAAIGLEVPYYALLDGKHQRQDDDASDPIIRTLEDAALQIGMIIRLLKDKPLAASIRSTEPGEGKS